MKKQISIIFLFIFGILIFTGCGTQEPVKQELKPVKIELSKDNFNEYIILNVQFNNADYKTQNGILGAEYKGIATLDASAKLRSDVQVENVVIEGKVTPGGMLWSTTEFAFKLELDKNGEAEYSEDIDTGDYVVFLKPEEKPIMSTYLGELKENEFLLNDDKILITSLTGSIYEK